MKRILISATVIALSLSTYAQDLIIKTEGDKFHDNFCIQELQSLKHSVDQDGNASVNLRMWNGARYTVTPDQITSMTTISRDEILKRGKYANMVYAREFNSVSELNKGDLIGVFDELDYSTEEFYNTVYADLAGYGFSSITNIFTGAVANNVKLLAAANFQSSDNIRFHVVDYVYVGVDVNGENVPLSARMIYPYSTGRAIKLSGIYVDNHVTVFMRNGEPSSKFSAFSMAAYSSKGYLVIQPDLLGYGVSDDRTQLYVDREINGAGVAYSIVAANQYADIAATKADGYTLASNAKMIMAGSSQGASTAIDGTYYIENRLEKSLADALPPLSETHVCAGVYDIKRSMEIFAHDDSLMYGCKLPMIVEAAVISHPEWICDPDGNRYNVEDFFTPTIGNIVFTNAYGKTGTLWELMDEKTMFEGIFTKYYASPDAVGYSSLAKILNPELLTKDPEGYNTLNYDSPKIKALLPYFEYNRMTNSDLWVPKSDIVMVHCSNDVIIPFENAQEMYDAMAEKMKQNGHTLQLKNLGELPNPNVQFSSHQISCFVWIVSELTGISVDIICPLIKQMLNSQS